MYCTRDPGKPGINAARKGLHTCLVTALSWTKWVLLPRPERACFVLSEPFLSFANAARVMSFGAIVLPLLAYQKLMTSFDRLSRKLMQKILQWLGQPHLHRECATRMCRAWDGFTCVVVDENCVP